MRISIPSTVLEAGSYEVQFTIDGSQVTGLLELGSMKVPVADVSGGSGHQGAFPKQPQEVERLVGHLKTNHDVIFYDAQITEYFPGRYRVIAPYALIGLYVLKIEGSIRNAEIQVEGLDEFIWNPPLGNWSWPTPEVDQFEVKLNKPYGTKWESGDVVIECGYRWEVSDNKNYQFNISFMPVLAISRTDVLDIRGWIEEYAIPIFRLMSFDMRRQCNPSWVVLKSGDDEPGMPIRAQIFAGGITQESYLATRPELIESDDRPLFTVQNLPSSLQELIARWKELDSSDNPFPELYRLASAPGLPDRARFLYLVQALEALHGYENRADDDQRQVAHQSRRAEFLNKIKEKLGGEVYRLAKNLVSTRVIDSLDRRIKEICDATPATIIARLAHGQDDPIVVHYVAGGNDKSFKEIIRLLRNDLSHGNYNPPSWELVPWTARLDRLAQAQLLRLLGFDESVIESRLS